MSAALQAPLALTMTAGEFLAWNPGDGFAWQLVDGDPQAMAPASPVHGLLQSELARLIANHLDRVGGPCRVLTAPGIVPRVRSGSNVRIPDLAVTCAAVTAQDATLSAPRLIIEIMSPSNRAETWANIWSYTTIPSVEEILIVHSTEVAVDILRRNSGESWPADPERVEEGDVWLSSIGLRVALASVYRGIDLTPPDPAEPDPS